MLSKVIDWTAGSFFRTIGRLLVFVIFGFVIAHFIDFSDIITNFRITDLFFEKVNASTNQRLQIANPTINGDGVTVPGIGWYVSNNQYYYQMNTQNPTQGVWNQVNYDFDTITFPANTKTMTIGLYVHNSDSLTQTYDYTAYSEGYMIYASGKNLYSLSLYYDGPSGFNYCDPVGNNGEFFYFTCPIVTNNFNRFALTIHTNRTSYNFASYFTFGIRSAITLDMEGNNISDLIQNDNANTQAIINSQNQNTNAINNQTQQQQQQHDEIMDTNTTETESEASSFFEDFSVTDHGGLSSILTAPLTIFNSILNDTCVPATFTYRGKEVSLPCGQDFWNKAPNLRDWLSTLESGIIAYAILISLFKMIQKLESPSNSEVEVESL